MTASITTAQSEDFLSPDTANIDSICRIAFSPDTHIREIIFSADCGFPSPAADYACDDLDIRDFFLPNPIASFAVTLRGDALCGIGLFDGDKLFIDRSLEPRSGDLVLCYLDGEFLVRRLGKEKGKTVLLSGNPDFPAIFPDNCGTFFIEGTVISCGRRFIRYGSEEKKPK